ncbi:MAG: 3'-5' exoribonuclease [Dinghuibacter sp.]|nr:3'-5' exoribonuclease [Dinghuibacter sp.]
MRLFLDCEFTGLHQHTTLISMALFAGDDCYFYAEFNDYNREQVTDWLEANVISKLKFPNEAGFSAVAGKRVEIKAGLPEVAATLATWLKHFAQVEIWADVLAYDWVLFCELFGGALNVPSNIFYAPFDLATLFYREGHIEPVNNYEKDISRYQYAGANEALRHNALEDARVEKLCYDKLVAG